MLGSSYHHQSIVDVVEHGHERDHLGCHDVEGARVGEHLAVAGLEIVSFDVGRDRDLGSPTNACPRLVEDSVRVGIFAIERLGVTNRQIPESATEIRTSGVHTKEPRDDRPRRIDDLTVERIENPVSHRRATVRGPNSTDRDHAVSIAESAHQVARI